MRPPLFGGPQKHSSSNLLPFCGSKKGTICAVRECGALQTIGANLGSESLVDHQKGYVAKLLPFAIEKRSGKFFQTS